MRRSLSPLPHVHFLLTPNLLPASGMGLAVTERLVSQGWNVTIMDLNEEAGHEVAERLGHQVLFLKADVTSYEEQGEVFRRTWERWGRLNFGMC